MRLAMLAAVGLALASSCGGLDDTARNDPLLRQPSSTTSQTGTATKQVQLYLRYERDQHDLVKIAPGPCGWPTLNGVGDSVTFSYLVQEDMAPGNFGLSISPFYSYGNPLVRIELVRDSGAGSEVLAKTEHRFLDAAPTRADLELPVAKYVAAGDTLRLRITSLEAGDPRYWLRLVINAGNGERSSSLACPLRTST